MLETQQIANLSGRSCSECGGRRLPRCCFTPSGVRRGVVRFPSSEPSVIKGNGNPHKLRYSFFLIKLK